MWGVRDRPPRPLRIRCTCFRRLPLPFSSPPPYPPLPVSETHTFFDLIGMKDATRWKWLIHEKIDLENLEEEQIELKKEILNKVKIEEEEEKGKQIERIRAAFRKENEANKRGMPKVGFSAPAPGGTQQQPSTTVTKSKMMKVPGGPLKLKKKRGEGDSKSEQPDPKRRRFGEQG